MDRARDRHEARFSVMGTTAHVVVRGGPPGALETARRRLDELERRWSRFEADSELTRLNRGAGAPVAVSADTRLLVARSCEGWRRTGGRFDPTVLDAVLAAGYDRTFSALRADPPPLAPSRPAPGCERVVVDDQAGTASLPAGVGLDPGAIGKGLAADLAVAQLLGAGAAGACVNVGGDLRVGGDGPGAAWAVTVEDPFERESHAVDLRLRGGGVASTWRTRLAWGPADDRRHHVIDPATGRSARSGLAGVCVVASEAWWAEVLATAAFVAGRDEAVELLTGEGVAALVVDDFGEQHPVGGFDAHRD